MAFTLGALAGAAGGGLSVWAVFHADFWAFCAGTALVGVFQAFAQYYRLAADAVEPAAKSRAISVVMAGGVIAAIAGPALAAWSRDLFAPVAFAGAYLMVALLALLSAALLWVGYRDAEAPAAAGETQAGLRAAAARSGPPAGVRRRACQQRGGVGFDDVHHDRRAAGRRGVQPRHRRRRQHHAMAPGRHVRAGFLPAR